MTVERKKELAREIFARMFEQMEPLRCKSECHDVAVDQFEDDLMLRDGLPTRILKPHWPYDLATTIVQEARDDNEEGDWHRRMTSVHDYSDFLLDLRQRHEAAALEIYAVYQAAAREIIAAFEAEELV